MRESCAACGFDNDFDGIALRDDLLLGQFRKPARAPEAQLIALALASSSNGANDSGDRGRRFIQIDGRMAALAWVAPASAESTRGPARARWRATPRGRMPATR